METNVLENLSTELTDLLVDINIELFEAILVEDYEKAAHIRDRISFNIDQASEIFEAHTQIPKEEIITKFTGLSAHILGELEKKHKNTSK